VPPARLGKVMGLYVGGTAFGGMVGRVAIGGLTEFLSWRAAMGTLSVIAGISALAFILLLPPSRNFKRQPGLNLRFHLQAWKTHLADAGMQRYFLVGFLSMGAFVTIYNYAGFRLMAAPYQLGQTQIGLIFLSYVFGIFASSSAGALVDRLGRARIIACGAVVTLLGLALTLSAALPVIIAGICVVTVGFFIVHSVASGAVARLANGNKGHASSLYLLSYYAGASLLGSVGGAVWHGGQWTALVVFAGVLVLAVLWIAFSLRQPRVFDGDGGSPRGARSGREAG
jgi:YNFM family putative membrane transporter